MRTPTDPLGLYMRSLRRARHMTMRNVDSIVSISPSVLSRLEHGERPPTRLECILLCQAYNLSAYETHRLFTMAGFLPEIQPMGRVESARLIAEQMLQEVRFPGVLMDGLGNVLAWNSALDEIWKPSRTAPVHVLDDLFTPHARTLLGDEWRSYVARSIWVYVQRTLGRAHDQAYRATLQRLEAIHGDEFVRLLDEARDGSHPDTVEMAQLGLSLQHDTPEGKIRYAVSQLLMDSSAALEVYVHLPLGEESLQRYDTFFRTLGRNQVIRAAA